MNAEKIFAIVAAWLVGVAAGYTFAFSIEVAWSFGKFVSSHCSL